MEQITNSIELIERLKGNQNVLGILQYGSGVASGGADTDICVVLSERPEGLESIHFWIGTGPVDMNIRTLKELQEGGVAGLPGLDDVLREGQVLYEQEAGLLQGISGRRAARSSAPGPAALAGLRHGHAHVLHKLDYYDEDLFPESLETNFSGMYFICPVSASQSLVS